MPKRRIVVLQDDKAWSEYLLEAFDDTPSTPEIAVSSQDGLNLIRRGNLDVVFASPKLLTKPLIAALQTHRTSNSNFRAFSLGKNQEALFFPFDDNFDETPPTLHDFQKKLAQHLPLPSPIHLLVVDDNPEIPGLFRDYFDHRTDPVFLVDTAQNGLEAEKKIEKESPHVMILDIKMPEKNGRELFRDLKQKGKLPPTVVYIDAIAAEEILEIRQWGSPAFVEKGSGSSTMPVMASLIKKLAYFG